MWPTHEGLAANSPNTPLNTPLYLIKRDHRSMNMCHFCNHCILHSCSGYYPTKKDKRVSEVVGDHFNNKSPENESWLCRVEFGKENKQIRCC